MIQYASARLVICMLLMLPVKVPVVRAELEDSDIWVLRTCYYAGSIDSL